VEEDCPLERGLDGTGGSLLVGGGGGIREEACGTDGGLLVGGGGGVFEEKVRVCVRFL